MHEFRTVLICDQLEDRRIDTVAIKNILPWKAENDSKPMTCQ